MQEPEDITLMTEKERQLLSKVQQSPFVVAQMKNPSEEFLLLAVCLNPYIIRFVHNQSFLLRLLAVKLDYRTMQYVNGRTPEILMAASKHNANGVMGKDLTHDEIELHANAFNVMKFGFAAQPPKKGM